MSFASRGLHDEGHVVTGGGEIDPGMEVIRRQNQNTIVGYAWINRHPDHPPTQGEDNTKYVLLFEDYVIPGAPQFNRDPDEQLSFKWTANSLTLAAAIASRPGKHYTFVKVVTTIAQKSW
jgi:hypothetical protein